MVTKQQQTEEQRKRKKRETWRNTLTYPTIPATDEYAKSLAFLGRMQRAARKLRAGAKACKELLKNDHIGLSGSEIIKRNVKGKPKKKRFLG